MAKHEKGRGSMDQRVDVGAKPALSHNPFAALVGRAAEATSTTEAPDARPADAPGVSAGSAAHATPPKVVEKESPKLGRVTLRRETKRRGGKAVVVVTGFGSTSPLDRSAVGTLASELKRVLGCGGTVESNGGELEIVIQGDQPARVTELLRAHGFRVGGVTS